MWICRSKYRNPILLEKLVKKVQAMEFAEKQLIIMQPEEVQTSRTWLKVTQDKRHDFPSNKCCFSCRSSIHLANKFTVAKKKKKKKQE